MNIRDSKSERKLSWEDTGKLKKVPSLITDKQNCCCTNANSPIPPSFTENENTQINILIDILNSWVMGSELVE